MFLQSLALRDIRSIHSLDLDFTLPGQKGRPWTFVLGENGVGKSTVLRAIALVLSGGQALFELIGEPDDWIRLGQPSAAIHVRFATQAGELREARLEFRRGEKLREFLARNSASLDQIDSAVEHADRNYFVVAYGVTRKPAGDPHSTSRPASTFRTPRARAVATLFSTDATLVSLENWAMDLDYRMGEPGLQAVRSALDTLLPSVTFGGIDRNQRRLIFRTRDGDLPLSALSDGYQAMAAWCGDLLWQITEAFRDYKEPLRARGLLLVDELDLHLHPVWQRELVAFLKVTLPNFQVVATTHSPLTVHQAGERELVVLRRGASGEVEAKVYEGAPNRLMLHQLLQSPIFGLETLDSPQVEQARAALRVLQSAPDIDLGNDPRVEGLKAELADVPNWAETRPYLQRTNEVLEQISRQLGGDGADPLGSLSQRAQRGSDKT